MALGLCNVFHSVLFTLQLPDLFAAESNLLLQLHDLVFELVNGCLKAEGLLGADGLVGLACDGGTHCGKTASGSNFARGQPTSITIACIH